MEKGSNPVGDDMRKFLQSLHFYGGEWIAFFNYKRAKYAMKPW